MRFFTTTIILSFLAFAYQSGCFQKCEHIVEDGRQVVNALPRVLSQAQATLDGK